LVRGPDAALVVLWCKSVAFVCSGAATLVLLARGLAPQLPPIGAALGWPHGATFALYLVANAVLEGSAIILNYRALQVSPLSLCVPFMALTPLFLLPIGRLFLHETISVGMVVGVLLVVVGSLVINRQRFTRGWLEPARAIFHERGSRYMFFVALLLACTATLDKWFVSSGGDAELAVRASRSFTLAVGKSGTLLIFFLGLAAVRRRAAADPTQAASHFESRRIWREAPAWVIAAGILEAFVLSLQLLAIQFSPLALVISIKRSGIVLGCAMGWLFFKERGITDRVIGACAMLTGVLIFFLTKPDETGDTALDSFGAVMVALVVLAVLSAVLWLTRDNNRKESVAA
jgi:uncharacterized membrane protein